MEISGIYFDTGKSVSKPESNASVTEIFKLFKEEPNLKIFVAGRTDNVASLDMNMTLSQAPTQWYMQYTFGTVFINIKESLHEQYIHSDR